MSDGNEKNGSVQQDVTKPVTGDAQKRQQEILDFLQEMNSARDEKAAGEEALASMRKALRRREKRQKELEANLKRCEDREALILRMAEIPTDAEDRPNRTHAIEAYFDLLNLCRFKKSDGFKTFSEMYNQVRPISKLFEFVAASARYDETARHIIIDCPQLYGLIRRHLDEQEALKKQLREELDRMEKEYVCVSVDTKKASDTENGSVLASEK